MSTQTIRIDFTTMASAADSIDQAASRMQAQLDALREYTNRATAAWEGDARDAYLRLQQDWIRAQDELIANLRRIASALRSSRDRFMSLERRNMSVLGG